MSIYLYMYISIYIYLSIHLFVNLYVYTYLYIYIYKLVVSLSICIYIYVYTYIYIYIFYIKILCQLTFHLSPSVDGRNAMGQAGQPHDHTLTTTETARGKGIRLGYDTTGNASMDLKHLYFLIATVY